MTTLILGLLIITLAAVSPAHLSRLVPRASAATRTMFLTGDTIGGVPLWNGTTPNANPTITVAEGDSVSVSMQSTDGTYHQLYVDVDKSYPGIVYAAPDKWSPPFLSSITYNFTVDFPAGTYTYYCSLHPFNMLGTFSVRGFTVTSNPSSLTIIQGSSTISTITLTSFNGFTGAANVTVTSTLPGPPPSTSPSSFNLPANGAAASNLSVSVPTTTAPGIYGILLNVTVNGIVHTVNLPVTVKEPGFSLNPNPSRLIILQGSSKTTNVTVTSLNTFNGTVTLANSTVLPVGISMDFTPRNMTLTTGQSTISKLNVTVSLGVPSIDFNLTMAGTSGSKTNTTVLSITVGRDFTLSAMPSNLRFSQGGSANSTITLSSVNGFVGVVSLILPGALPGVGVSFNTTVVGLSPGSSRFALVTFTAKQATVPSDYPLTIIGTNATRVHSLSLRVSISGFEIRIAQASLNITQGLEARVRPELVSLNGFSQTVSFMIVGSSSAVRASVTPVSVYLNANSNVTVTVALSALTGGGLTPIGSYTFNITATGGSVSHSSIINLTVTPSRPDSGSLYAAVLIPIAVGSLVLGSIFLFQRRKAARRYGTPKASLQEQSSHVGPHKH